MASAANCSKPMSRSRTAASSKSAASRAKARKRSTPGANWSRRALSTFTPIMTARSPGARTSRPRRRTASPPPIMGNCGVGFAPCRPADHQRLIQLMEGVEDIPEPVLSAGMPWAWESFPDYMDWLSQAQLRHGHRRATAARGVARLRDGRTRRAPRSRDGGGQQGDGRARGRRGAGRRAGLLDLAHPQPPHLYRRLHADAEGRRGRTDGDRRRDAPGRPQRAAIRARSGQHRGRPADDAAGGGEHPVPDFVFGRPGRQGAAALAPDAGQHQ